MAAAPLLALQIALIITFFAVAFLIFVMQLKSGLQGRILHHLQLNVGAAIYKPLGPCQLLTVSNTSNSRAISSAPQQ